MRKLASIKIYKDVVLSMIDGLTYKRVDGALAGESDQVKNAISSESDNSHLDAYLLRGRLEVRNAKIRQRLAFCLERDTEELSATNVLDLDDESFDYTLFVPEYFDKSRLQVLTAKINNYLVQGSLYDWYATQNLKGDVSADALEDMETEIVCMLRASFIKRPLQPFGPQK